MTKSDFLPILQQLQAERRITKEILVDALSTAIETAARKANQGSDELTVDIDEDTWEIHVYTGKNVVESVADSRKEIGLEEAKEIDPEAEFGGVVKVEIEPKGFGRIAAQAAKQVIIQKIKDAERESIYEEFKNKEGEVITGIIKRESRGNVIADLGRAEALLPPREQSSREQYRFGDRIKAYVLKVEQTPRGPEIILSRATPLLVRALFEFEVPEIFDKVIEIQTIAREPGHRTKVAILSNDPNVDPVGACVGLKGARVRSIVEELNGEKIDIIKWHEDPAIFAHNALTPAEISSIRVDEENHSLEVLVPRDQLSLAIGKKGQNARLAAKLTGWKIDIKCEEDVRSAEAAKAEEFLEENRRQTALGKLLDLPAVREKTAQALAEAGFESIEMIAVATLKDLCKVPGLGPKTSQKILDTAREMEPEAALRQAFRLDQLAEEKKKKEEEEIVLDAASVFGKGTEDSEDGGSEESPSESEEAAEVSEESSESTGDEASDEASAEDQNDENEENHSLQAAAEAVNLGDPEGDPSGEEDAADDGASPAEIERAGTEEDGSK